jgi:hypothetical protein
MFSVISGRQTRAKVMNAKGEMVEGESKNGKEDKKQLWWGDNCDKKTFCACMEV